MSDTTFNIEPEPEQPTPAAEILIDLIKRVSELERKVNILEHAI